ncbi:SAC3/GANP/Nin1/mts3/eIF-3 p25 family-domain-containing protein [Dipodascopsis uninucleata]
MKKLQSKRVDRGGARKNLYSEMNSSDDWDAQNQAAMNRLAETWKGDIKSLYEKLQSVRAKERTEMENRGLVDKQDVRKTLDQAIKFTGSCTDMCPVFERVRRTFENNVAPWERNASGKIDRGLAIKAFSRPAAGQPPPLPSDVRPPAVLQRTLAFLIDNVIPNLPESHAFLWDRTRSIRQDFTYQNYTGPEAIDCNERIARIHIVCLHVLAGSNIEYSRQQELEQFNKALQTLSEFYEDTRKLGGQCPNEAEFQAYRLLSHIRDADLERQVQSLPMHILLDPQVQLVLELRKLAQQNNITERGYTNTENASNMYSRFFKLLRTSSVPYLFACLAEVHFNDIRMWALKSMSSGYHKRGKPYVAAHLAKVLGCDSEQELLDLCDHWELTRKRDDGIECIDVTSWNEQRTLSKPPAKQAYSKTIVEIKQGTLTLQQYINGTSSRGNDTTIPLKISNSTSLPITHSRASMGILPEPSVSAFANVNATPSRSGALSGNFVKPESLESISKSNHVYEPKKDIYDMNRQRSQQMKSVSPLAHQNSFVFGGHSINEVFNTPMLSNQKPDLGQKSKKRSFSSEDNFHSSETSSHVENARINPSLFQTLDSPSTLNRISTGALSTSSIKSPFSTSSVPETSKSSATVFSKPYRNISRDLLKSECDDVIRSVVASEIKSIISNSVSIHTKELERKTRFWSNLSTELFSSMVFDNTWQACEEALSDHFRRSALLKSTLKMISMTAKRAKNSADLRKKRQEQVNDAAMLLGRPIKKQRLTKKRSLNSLSEEERVILMQEQRRVVLDLWKPLDLERVFVTYIAKKFSNAGVLDGIIDVNVFTSDWHSSSGIWLRKKFGLEWCDNKFVRNIESKNVNVSFASMSDDEDTYENVACLVFQCGLTGTENNIEAESKLRFDSEALLEALKRLYKFSVYSISLLVLYWSFEGISNNEVYQALHLDQLLNPRYGLVSSIGFVTIDDVSELDMNAAIQYMAKSIVI